VANVRVIGIAKPTVITAQGVPNAQAIIALSIAHVKKSEHVKCVLLNGNHPANYKRCTVYKEIQNRTFPPLRNKLEGKPLAAQPQTYTRPGTSYTSALTSQQYETATSSMQQIPTQQQQIQPQPCEIHELKTMMKRLMKQMNTMLNLLTTVLSKMT
jgi:hypothetical protein